MMIETTIQLIIVIAKATQLQNSKYFNAKKTVQFQLKLWTTECEL